MSTATAVETARPWTEEPSTFGMHSARYPCLAQQWRQGQRPRGLYLNTGYNPGNAGRVTPACDQRSRNAGSTADRVRPDQA